MKKKILLGLFTGICITLAACGTSKDNSNNEETKTVYEETEEATAVTESDDADSSDLAQTDIAESENVDSAESEDTDEKQDTVLGANSMLSDDIYAYELLIDGDVLKVPMSFKELESLGYEFSGDATEKLASNYYTTSQYFAKGETKLACQIANYDINELPYSDCYIAQIKLDDFDLRNSDARIEFAKGIVYGESTMEDVIAAYGEPSETRESDSYPAVTYSTGTYSKIKFRFDAANGNVMTDVEIENNVKPEDIEESSVDSSTPELVLAYKTPESAVDFEKGIIAVEGDYYQLPVPLSVILDNGWEFVDDVKADDIVSGDDFAGIFNFTKNGQTIRISVQNYSGNATELQNCFAIKVAVFSSSAEADMVIFNDIRLDMTVAELEKALDGYSYEKDDSSSLLTYYNISAFETYSDGYSICVNNETGKVTGVEIVRWPKTKDMSADIWN